MKRSIPLRIGFLSVLASFVFILSLFTMTGTASAHTAVSANTATSAWGGDGWGDRGDFGERGFGWGYSSWDDNPGYYDYGYSDCSGYYSYYGDCGFDYGYSYHHHHHHHHHHDD